MKKTKLTRIFVLILSLALLVGSAVGIAASAEESDTYAIKAINIAHGDRTQVLIAVDAVGVDASAIEVKYTIGTTTKVADFYDNIDIYGDGVLYPVFYTAGIAAKDCGQDVVAEAHVAGTTPASPEYKNVSVASYLFGKLYKEGFIAATEGEDLDKKNLYLAFIEYIASAEEVLYNLKNPENPRTLLTDVNYVYVKDGGSIKGANTAILKADGAVILTPDNYVAGQVWEVKSYDSQGNVTTTYAEGNRVPITANSVITATVDPCVMNFDNLTVGNTLSGTFATSNDGGYVQLNTAGSSGNVPTVVAMDDEGNDKGITQYSGTYYWFYWNNRGTGVGDVKNNANVSVIEFDVDFRSATAGKYEQLTIRTSTGGVNPFNVQFGYKDATNGYVINLGSTVIKTGLYGTGDNHAEKFVFRMDYKWSTGEIKFSVNGEMVYYGLTTASDTPIFRNYYTSYGNGDIYLDNVKVKNTYIESIAPVAKYVDFSADPVSDPQEWTTTNSSYLDEITNDAFTYGGVPSEMGYTADTVFTADKFTFDNVVVSYSGNTRVSDSSVEIVTEEDGNKYLQLNNAARISTRDRAYGIAVSPQFVHSSLYYLDFDFKVSSGDVSFIVYDTTSKLYCQWTIKAPDAGGITIGGVSVPGARNEWVSLRVVFDLSEAAPVFKAYTKNADGEYVYAGDFVTTTDSTAEGYSAATDTTKLSGVTIRDISMASTESKSATTLCFDNVALYTVDK